MIPHQLPEFAVKAAKDGRTITMVLKYIALVAVAISTVAVCALFVKVSLLPAKPYRPPPHPKLVPIKENNIEKKDQLYVVDVNIEFEPQTTVNPKLEAPKQIDSVAQDIIRKENENLRRQLLKSHVFQSEKPKTVTTTVTTTPTPRLPILPNIKSILKQAVNNVEFVEQVTTTEKTINRNENTNVFETTLNHDSFGNLFVPTFTFVDKSEPQIKTETNNEKHPFQDFFKFHIKPIFDSKESNPEIETETNTDYHPFQNFFDFHIKPIFDSEETQFISPIQFHDNFYNIPIDEPVYDSHEEVIKPVDTSSPEVINLFQVPRIIDNWFFNSDGEQIPIDITSHEEVITPIDSSSSESGNFVQVPKIIDNFGFGPEEEPITIDITSPEEVIIEPIDTSTFDAGNLFHLPSILDNWFFDPEEKVIPIDSTSSSDERSKSSETLEVDVDHPIQDFYRQTFSNFFDDLF